MMVTMSSPRLALIFHSVIHISKEVFTENGSQEPGDREALCQCHKIEYSRIQTVYMCVEAQFRPRPGEMEPVTTSLFVFSRLENQTKRIHLSVCTCLQDGGTLLVITICRGDP